MMDSKIQGFENAGMQGCRDSGTSKHDVAWPFMRLTALLPPKMPLRKRRVAYLGVF